MPAVTPSDPLTLPRLSTPAPGTLPRPVVGVVDAPRFLEGDGFQVRRAFAGIDLRYADPFLMLDHMGAVEYAPGEAKGASDHPHRGFETVTYMLDGEIEHRDSNGGGGVITDGATQWMTAGAGIVHSELPTEDLVRQGRALPRRAALGQPPCRAEVEPGALPGHRLAERGAAQLARRRRGRPCDRGRDRRTRRGRAARGRRSRTRTSRSPPARACRCRGGATSTRSSTCSRAAGSLGPEQEPAPIGEGQLGVHGDGDWLGLRADERQDAATPNLEILLLGGRPIGEPIAWYGPFVMNTKAEIIEAIEDYQAGRMGSIPAETADA